jgi:hypothetical protein
MTRKYTLEQVEIVTKTGEKEIWQIPFAWYSTPWGESYEPKKESGMRAFLSKVKEWRIVGKNKWNEPLFKPHED